MTETQISALQAALQKYPQVLFTYLFGSQATGKVTPMSDVDIAVYFDERLSATEQFRLRLELIGVLGEAMTWKWPFSMTKRLSCIMKW